MADSSLEMRMNNLKLSDRSPPPLVPDHTPAETHASVFEATTPPFSPASPGDEVDQEAEVEELLEYDVTSLKSDDVKADPILADLARKQGRPVSQKSSTGPSSVAFRARPAPSSTRQQGLGPRMTKSAALRQGLDWAALSSPGKRDPASEMANSMASVLSQKKAGVQAVASLSAPAIAPRPTRASTLRTGRDGGAASPVAKKDYAAQAIANKAKEKEERERRRKSVALPASLSAPSIAPRQNKSSALRTGAPLPVATRALTVTSADNLAPLKTPTAPQAGLARRASMGVKSLGAPSIAPRLNKAALLRAPGSASSVPPAHPTRATVVPPSPRTGRSTATGTSGTSSIAAKPPKARPTSMMSPRPTKSSLLREGLGAHIGVREI